jgi:hypothetical protein
MIYLMYLVRCRQGFHQLWIHCRFPGKAGVLTWVNPEPRGLPAPWRVEDYLQAASERSASHVRTRRPAR